MNELLFVLQIVVVFGSLVLANRYLGKTGVYCHVVCMVIYSTLFVSKFITIFNFDTTGTAIVFFASNFLAADILAENYGKQAAKKVPIIIACSQIFFLIVSSMVLMFTPTSFDIAHEPLQIVLKQVPIVAIVGLLLMIAGNYLNVYIYSKLKDKTGSRLIWLRNTIATFMGNCLENFIFVAVLQLVLFGEINNYLEIVFVGIILEMLCSAVSNPFLYLARRWKNNDIKGA